MSDFRIADQASLGRLDIQLLQSLLAIAHSPTLSSAAERLNIPQPTMSLQMKRLEKRAGKLLFEPSRRGRPLKLSVHGERLVRHAERVMEAYEDAVNCLNCEALTGSFTLGVPELICESGLRTVLTRFKNIFSDVNLTIVISDEKSLETMLDEGKISARICIDGDHQNKGRLLWSEPFVWVSANDAIIEENESLPIALYSKKEPFGQYVRGLLDESDKDWHEVFESDCLTKLLASTISGECLAVLPKSSVNDELISFDKDSGLPELEIIPFVIYNAEGLDDDELKISGTLSDFIEEKMGLLAKP